ncbi:MAG: AAA family ATPase [Gammaproteobacteria bacterium]|nr:AAA family ATPase [Gammaproteobacteria bacterium]
MLNSHERHLALSYLANMLGRLRRKRAQAANLLEWLADNAAPLASGGRSGERIAVAASNASESPANWRELRRLVDKARRAASDAPPDVMGRRLRRLGETVGLSSLDVDLLEVLLRYGTQPVVESLIDAAFLHMGGSRMPMNARGGALSCVLGRSVNLVADRFAEDAPLVRTGLVSIDQDQDIQAIGRLRRLDAPDPEEIDVRQFLLGAGGASELEWSDFEHLGQSREDVLRILRGAVDRGARGVNVLVYGPPGTGKTEFCRVLASKAGLDLFGVGEADDKGNEPSRQERLAELRLAQCLLGEDSGGVLLFDEMEDLLSGSTFPWTLFGSGRRGGESKVFMNRLLEETPAPTFWTTNIAGDIDPAILRRMTFALEMRQPSTNVRARVWQRQLSSHGIEATPAQTLALAREFDASPGVAAGATAAAALADGDFELVRRGVRSLSRVLGCDRPAFRGAHRFDATLLSADIDLTEVAARLADRGERRFSLCLQGPPGTGKSAYARYLAERMDLEVIQRRASDLLGMYVGQTEKNIAEAFAEARADEAFLVFDEADSLLADRRGAQRNWEISQVNEMLTWMESHPLPFACTTNYADKLDEAVLRRFTFKVTLGYLGTQSARSAFLAYFGTEAPSQLDGLDCLAPGDFEVVRRKAEVLGQLGDGDALVEMLRAECDMKPGRRAAIGFGAP